MTRSLETREIALIKATAPALRQHGIEITTRMYERLFKNAEIKAMFDAEEQKSGRQPKRLAAAIVAYAESIDKLEALTGAVERMVERHVETGVKPEHYPFVANALIPAISDILGDAATPEILDAWTKAYWVLADLLIGKEEERYRSQAAG